MHISKSFDEACEKRIAAVKSLAPGSKIHLLGACGTGMAAVLSLLKQLGFYCSGSDKAFYPPMGDFVRDVADEIFESYSADNISDSIDLVVIGNALSRGNEELEAVLEAGIPFASMPEVFSALLIGDRNHCPNSIVAAGTHGKTTTSAMMASLLESAGRKPGYFVGGIPGSLPSNVRPVDTSISKEKRTVVLEGDEYDSAFFAKFSKFHCYRPDFLIVTSLEFDHADIFESMADIDAEFLSLVKRVPETGVVLYCEDDAHLREQAAIWKSVSKAQFVSYGFSNSADARISDRSVNEGSQEVEAIFEDERISYEISVSGAYNALNSLACFVVAKKLGLSEEESQKGLSAYRPVARRQEIRFQTKDLVLIEDFAHHPTAVSKTLAGIRESYPGRNIVAVFEPRSNTSRRQFFQDAYGKSFTDADRSILLNVVDAGGYSKHSGPVLALDVEAVATEIRSGGSRASTHDSVEEIFNTVVEESIAGDVVVVMSNGSFDGLPSKLTQALEEKFEHKI